MLYIYIDFVFVLIDTRLFLPLRLPVFAFSMHPVFFWQISLVNSHVCSTDTDGNACRIVCDSCQLPCSACTAHLTVVVISGMCVV